MNVWTKLQKDESDHEGMSTLDLPWLGAMRADQDYWRLQLKYLGGSSRCRIWQDSATDASVEFQVSPFRVVQLRMPRALTESAGGAKRAVGHLMHSFFTDPAHKISKNECWEKIVCSAAEKVSNAQGVELERPNYKAAAG